MPFIFFLGALLSNVFVNVRYSVMLYPLFAVLTAIGSLIILEKLKLFISTKYHNSLFTKRKKLYSILIITIIFTHAISLYKIKPFFFNYTNSLLPKKFVVTDAWGYGFYEAAQYLNSLPDAENLVVWMDRSGVCQFFVGKCIASREIYFNHTDVDYLILTRRGSIIKKPTPITAEKNHWFTKTTYYSEKYFNTPEWEIFIDNRPKNFVKIINVNNPN